MAAEVHIDPARLREGARAALAELAVKHEVLDELQSLIDGKWSEIYDVENHLGVILAHLGLKTAGHPLDRHAAAKMLDKEAGHG